MSQLATTLASSYALKPRGYICIAISEQHSTALSSAWGRCSKHATLPGALHAACVPCIPSTQTAWTKWAAPLRPPMLFRLPTSRLQLYLHPHAAGPHFPPESNLLDESSTTALACSLHLSHQHALCMCNYGSVIVWGAADETFSGSRSPPMCTFVSDVMPAAGAGSVPQGVAESG